MQEGAGWYQITEKPVEAKIHFTILTSKIGVGEFPMTWAVDGSHGEMTVVISFHHGRGVVK